MCKVKYLKANFYLLCLPELENSFVFFKVLLYFFFCCKILIAKMTSFVA